MRSIIATLFVVVALIAVGATPVLAAPAELAAKVPPALNDKGGTISLKVQYRCTQFAAPYNASDGFNLSILHYVGVDEHGNNIVRGYYVNTALMICDGHDQKITLTMVPLRDGAMTGPGDLEITHQGFATDGSSGAWAVIKIPVTVR